MNSFMNSLGRGLGLTCLCIISALGGAVYGVLMQEDELTNLKREKLELEIENAKIKTELDELRKL